MTMRLTDEQIATARLLWSEGKTLGDIAATVECDVYVLSPWLYMDSLRDDLAAAEQRLIDEGELDAR